MGQMCKAVLLRRGGEEATIVEIPYPPAPDYLEPRRARRGFHEDPDPSRPRPEHRRYRLSSMRSKAPEARWMEVYNEGRSQTSHDGFVYVEERR